MRIKSIVHRILQLLPDKAYLSVVYRYYNGRRIDWNNPRTFTEKIQWLKLYNRRLDYTRMVDKITAKEYAALRLGNDAIIPTIACWDTTKDIDFEMLPDSFVLKTSHGGGSNGVIIVRDKKKADLEKYRSQMAKSLKSDIYNVYREWPYKDVRPRILAEPMMVNESDDELTDYKFYCFNGIPKFCQVIANRHKGETIDFFDTKWNHMPFWGLNQAETTVKQAACAPSKPINLELMIDYAAKLAAGIPFLRVDLYEINGKVYFGEMTFFPASGIGFFSPGEWDVRLGQMLDLSEVKGKIIRRKRCQMV